MSIWDDGDYLDEQADRADQHIAETGDPTMIDVTGTGGPIDGNVIGHLIDTGQFEEVKGDPLTPFDTIEDARQTYADKLRTAGFDLTGYKPDQIDHLF